MECALLALLVFITAPALSLARRQAPIIGGEQQPRRSRAAECMFGKQVRELGSTWFADLGPPFGVMYCIRCDCLPVQKKRRVVGKVHCRNIKHECVKPSCDEPVLLPGRCCKVCPADLSNPELAQDVAPQPSLEEEEKSFKYLAAVLTGRTTLGEVSSEPRGDLVATGRFAFHRRSLYFSFYASSRPRTIQFIDLKGNILEEQTVSAGSEYQNATGKVCGVWRRIPREYRRLIREEKLAVSLVWDTAHHAISGHLYRYRTLSTEMLSALLEGVPGAGGTAIISVSTTNPSIHLTVVFNGVFLPTQTSDVPITIRLQAHDKQAPVIDEVVKVAKPSGELNVVEVSSAVSAADLKMLTRHRLSVVVLNKASGQRLQGRAVGRAHCELHHALVAPRPGTADPDPLTPAPAAAAVLYLDRDAALRYSIRVHNLPQPSVIALVVERRLTELEDLSPSVSGSWVNGTLERLSPRHLEQLYSGELGINVATRDSASVARGRLASKHVADPRDSPAPALLLPTDTAVPTMAATAWAAIDPDCNLHYDVMMSGPGVEGSDYELYLSEVPLVAEGAPVSRRLLEQFSGPHLEGTLVSLLPGDLARIDAGMVHLEIEDVKAATTVLRAPWHKMVVPGSCLPDFSDNDVGMQGIEESGGEAPAVKCFHGERFHDEGTQWVPPTEPCLTCHCSLGTTKCDPIVCPTLPPNCLPPTPQPNQCCPICNNVSTSSSVKEVAELSKKQGCTMASRFHPVGSVWHPYLPPSSYDTCTQCTCLAGSLKIKCTRRECPRLECDEKTAVRPHHKACCKECPTLTPSVAGVMRDEVVRDPGQEMLAAGGCTAPFGGPFPNGHEWHPRVYSHGEIKCVKCRCKDGRVTCERKKCTKWSCNDECCASECPRGRRHTRPRP